MSTANKLRAKHQHTHHDNSPQNNITNSQPVTTPSNNQDSSQKYNQKQEVEDISSREGQFEKYYAYVEGNPMGVVPSASLFPANYSLYAEHNIPLGFEVSPVLPLCNQGTAISQKPLQMIPQCSSCRAFLNSYNKIKQDTFTCFLCQAKNPIPKQYTFNKSEPQHNHSLYRTACPSTTDETSYVFLVDVSPESARCKALYYFVEAVKHVFSRDSLDQVVVFFFTFDQTVHHYHFQGQDVKCLIYDETIDQGSVVSCMKGLKLGQIREKLFSVLDSLEQMSINNKRQGSNLTKCFDYVYNSLRTTNSKFLVLQCNQQITGQQMFSEQCAPKTKTPQKVAVKPQSRLQTENKTLINKYTNNLLNHQCGFSLFIFATNFKV